MTSKFLQWDMWANITGKNEFCSQPKPHKAKYKYLPLKYFCSSLLLQWERNIMLMYYLIFSYLFSQKREVKCLCRWDKWVRDGNSSVTSVWFQELPSRLFSDIPGIGKHNSSCSALSSPRSHVRIFWTNKAYELKLNPTATPYEENRTF